MNVDDTLTRLQDLTSKLQERLIEAEDIRARLANARRANRWPDVRHTSRRAADIPDLPYFRPSDDDSQTH